MGLKLEYVDANGPPARVRTLLKLLEWFIVFASV